MRRIISPSHKSLIFAVDEMNVAHNLYQNRYVSPTMLATMDMNLHDRTIKMKWPLDHIPQGQFAGRLNGNITNAHINAIVDLKLVNCAIRGILDNKTINKPASTGTLKGHFEGTLTGKVDGKLHGTLHSGCEDLYLNGHFRVINGPASRRSLATMLLYALPSDVVCITAGTVMGLRDYDSLKTSAGKRETTIMVDTFPYVTSPLSFIGNQSQTFSVEFSLTSLIGRYINMKPLQQHLDAPIMRQIDLMLQGRLRLAAGFIRMFYDACNNKVLSRSLYFSFGPPSPSSPPFSYSCCRRIFNYLPSISLL